MFNAYYDDRRFAYISNQIQSNKMFSKRGGELIRKTASFFSSDLNIYIDTSDGVNEDLDINEYCARILKVVQECEGKKFLFFKSAFSPIRSKNIIEIAESNNGKVIPFFKWSFNNNFYSHLIPNRSEIIEQSKKSNLEYDIGFFAGLDPYDYPRPNKIDSRLAWRDYGNFGMGSPENTGDYYITSRRDLFQKLTQQEDVFKVNRKTLNYPDYIQELLKCKTSLNPPGIGEYTSRMFDATFLGKCVVLRKSSYDNGISWKGHIPEIDFTKNTWIDDYQKIISNLSEWEEKSIEYYEKCWSPNSVFNYFVEKIEEVA